MPQLPAPRAPPSTTNYMMRMFKRKLPEVHNYTVPAWAHEEGTRAAPWNLTVNKGQSQMGGTIDLSKQARWLCGRSGGEAHGVDLDLGSHDTISRCAISSVRVNKD